MDQPNGPFSLRGIWRLLVDTVKDSGEDRILGLASEVAFFSLLSLPPTLLALLGGLGFVGSKLGPPTIEPIRERVLQMASTFLTPETVDSLVAPMVDNLLSQGRGDIVSIGIVIAIWSASRATNVLLEAVRIAYDVPKRRSYQRRALALGITIVGMLGAVVVLPLLVIGPELAASLVNPLGASEITRTTLEWLYWPIVGVLGISFLASIFHLSVPIRTPWRRDFPGAVFAAFLWVALSTLARVYARWTIEGAESIFGPLAAPIIILLWLYATSVAVLAGAELNAELEKLWPASTGSKDEPEQPVQT